MVEKKSDANITINFSTSDIQLGIANVIIALQRCGAIDMPQFLDELEKITAKTHWKGKGGEQNRSQFSQTLIQHLQKLTAQNDNEDK